MRNRKKCWLSYVYHDHDVKLPEIKNWCNIVNIPGISLKSQTISFDFKIPRYFHDFSADSGFLDSVGTLNVDGRDL